MRRSWLPLGCAVALAVGSCTGGGGDDEPVAEGASTTTTIRRSTAAEVPLSVGQCGDVPRLQVGGALDPATFVATDCAAPHTVEIGAVFDYPTGVDIPFPGGQNVDGYATDQCIERFEAYVGVDYLSSTLDFLIIAPDESGWDDGDRRIACVLYQTNFDPLLAPVAGSGI